MDLDFEVGSKVLVTESGLHAHVSGIYIDAVGTRYLVRWNDSHGLVCESYYAASELVDG